MSTPTIDLISLAVRNLDQITDAARRADLLDAAATVIRHDDNVLHDQIRATAAMLREAERAQLQLTRLFTQQA
jgi:hypothetical protein